MIRADSRPVDDYEALIPSLDARWARGARLAIDDAGAGLASLRHILRLAPDIIKTDITLTRNATSCAERALTAALVSFADEIDAIIVAEAIESQAEIDVLQGLGVRYGQGDHSGARRRSAHRRPTTWRTRGARRG